MQDVKKEPLPTYISYIAKDLISKIRLNLSLQGTWIPASDRESLVTDNSAS